MKSKLILGAALFSMTLSFLNSASVKFAADKNCVAYETKKSVAFITDKDIVGKNCNIEIARLKEGKDLFRLKVTVPISQFKSGDSKRDSSVAEILQANKKPDITFLTKEYTKQQFKDWAESKKGVMHGTLQLASGTFKVSSKFKLAGETASGSIHTTFSKLGMKPPKVGPGGLIAKGQEKLTLHYRIQTTKIKNLNLASK